jgi:hypothetical protein
MKPLVITHNKAKQSDEFRQTVQDSVMDEEVKHYLASVNGPAQSYALTTREELTRVCHRIEANLMLKGVKKKNIVGTEVTYQSSGRGRGNTPVTQVKIKKTGSGWRLIEASKCYVADYQTYTLMNLTLAAEQDIFSMAYEDIAIQTPSLSEQADAWPSC